MAFHCPSCGAGLVYDIKSRQMYCSSCRSSFDVQGFDTADTVQSENPDTVSGNDEYAVYLCSNCGAQLSAPADQIVAYCSYCGGEALLKKKDLSFHRPSRIIPFSKTKKEAAEQYKKELEKVLFLPKELKDAEFLKEFRGIYIPYWVKSLEIEEFDQTIPGSRSYTVGSYDYHETYELDVRFGGSMECVFDASLAFDDTVASEIAPFHITKSTEFHDGYLAGFYADAVTVPADAYTEATRQVAEHSASANIVRLSGISPTSSGWEKKLVMKEAGDDTVMFPVWFLTWKRGKRLAYSVMNGQTGRLSADLPVDYRVFFRYAGIAALVIFAVLSILPVFILPLRTAGFSTALMFLAMLCLNYEMKMIIQKEQHSYDLGYMDAKQREKLKGEDSEKLEKFRRKKAEKLFRNYTGPRDSSPSVNIGCLSAAGGIFTAIASFLLIVFCLSVETPSDLLAILVCTLFLQIIYSALAVRKLMQIRNKAAAASVVLNLVILLASIMIAGPEHPHDYWYYGIASAALFGMTVNMLTCIYYLNYMTTRPVPDFFTREGADHDREK